MKKILVPCDFSEEALNAFRSAISLARIQKSEIHLLHVIELPVMHDALLMPALNFEESVLNALKVRAENGYKKIMTEATNQDLIFSHISFGPTSHVILSFIKENKIDLVVMGTKGSSGITEVFIGSNTEKIVRSSLAPVLTVRNVIDFGSLKKIAFPAPLNFHDEEQLIVRVKLLQDFLKASLHIVWINTPSNFSPDHKTRGLLTALATRHLLSNYTISIFNDVYEESGIINFCHDINADLIAMGTHGRKGLAHLFSRSLTEDVVNHIDLPVWTYSVHKVKEEKIIPVD